MKTIDLAIWEPNPERKGALRYVGFEAMGAKYSVVKTQLDGRGWTHWLKIPYIECN